MGMSFREKSLWLMFLSLAIAFGLYFAWILPAAGPDVGPTQIGLFFSVVVFLVLTQIVGHVAIAIVDRRSEEDERDRLIELRGTRNGAYVLATGVFFSLGTAVGTDGNFMFVHVLLGSWVVAQLVETGSQLVLHRRGA